MTIDINSVRPVLRPVPGDGILARQGDLVLLCDASAEWAPQVNRLLDTLGEVAARGDGRDLCRRLTHLLSDDGDAGGYPALCAFGPCPDGWAVLLHGRALATLSGPVGPIHLDGRESVTCVNRLVDPDVTLTSVRLGEEATDRDADDWSVLQSGVIRAGGVLAADAAAPTSPAPPVGPLLNVPPPAPPVGPLLNVPPPVSSGHPRMCGCAACVAAPATTGHPEQCACTACLPPATDRPPATPTAPPVPPTGPDVASALVQPVSAPPAPDPDAPSVPVHPISAPPATGPAAPEGPGPRAGAGPAPTPTVLGVRCRDGHLNDPRAPYCGTCGLSNANGGLDPEPGPRPPLGVLTFDDGSTYPLDRGYLLGRSPDSGDGGDGGCEPLAVDDRDASVSRVHARVDIDGWDVRLTDNGSTNGTFVWVEERNQWDRLRPGVPVVVAPGSWLRIGLRTLRYHSHRGI
ncbi:FHA domain-containing protein [Micromonospora endolithica]|uniref:FHA domain-containing protein n=1 Tax=Micromonospora endolithica TaxID=230091 RepID=A0A3A9ZKK9_9ACTN|nr:FHA domain-containing protein [Micromonospora endolithica]RKN47826.1 FHA domain-containing protein [Micromonospora endolithica]TWJ21511.1 FHA domain-containing protein [Micromonospora endolithica]